MQCVLKFSKGYSTSVEGNHLSPKHRSENDGSWGQWFMKWVVVTTVTTTLGSFLLSLISVSSGNPLGLRVK